VINKREIAIKYSDRLVISSAQNREDVLLNRVFFNQPSGFYVDIGSGDPNWDSVTNWFYRLGWRGINVDPNPIFTNSYSYWRKEDTFVNKGCSDESGILTFTQVIQNDIGQGWGLSSFDANSELLAVSNGFDVKRIEVPCVTLMSIVNEYVNCKVDFLKVDVEGYESKVISSIDFSVFRPRVMIIESVSPMTSAPAYDDYENTILNANYVFAFFDGVNNYYVARESIELLPQFNAGVNVNDKYRKMEESDLFN
jgi:FkbM family methyltransferase